MRAARNLRPRKAATRGGHSDADMSKPSPAQLTAPGNRAAGPWHVRAVRCVPCRRLCSLANGTGRAAGPVPRTGAWRHRDRQTTAPSSTFRRHRLCLNVPNMGQSSAGAGRFRTNAPLNDALKLRIEPPSPDSSRGGGGQRPRRAGSPWPARTSRGDGISLWPDAGTPRSVPQSAPAGFRHRPGPRHQSASRSGTAGSRWSQSPATFGSRAAEEA